MYHLKTGKDTIVSVSSHLGAETISQLIVYSSSTENQYATSPVMKLYCKNCLNKSYKKYSCSNY